MINKTDDKTDDNKIIKKINWAAISVAIGLIAMILGWVWSIEHRLSRSMDVSGRLTNIEEALYPVLVDFKVNQIINDMDIDHGHDHSHDPTVSTVEPSPIMMEPPQPIEDIEQAAKMWAQEQLLFN